MLLIFVSTDMLRHNMIEYEMIEDYQKKLPLTKICTRKKYCVFKISFNVAHTRDNILFNQLTMAH